MKKTISIILVCITLLSYNYLHKYYVSITQVEYVKEKQNLQIITRIFVDDLELTLKKRYGENIVLSEEQESDLAEYYIESYLTSKLYISINNELITPKYLGKEYLNDVLICYLEIENVSQIHNIEIRNSILFDTFSDQKNIVRLSINGFYKTFIQNRENPKGVLNFD